MTDNFAENLRFLLWKKEPARREKWKGLVANWTGCDRQRTLEILRGSKPSEDEVRKIAVSVNLEADTLLYSKLLEPSEILSQNIDYLFAGLDHGSRGKYAEALEVDLSTVSRWRKGKARPTRSHLDKLRAKFLLGPEDDLENNPLFLSLTPISAGQRREWMKARIDQLTPAQLNELFPALRRLLGDEDATD